MKVITLLKLLIWRIIWLISNIGLRISCWSTRLTVEQTSPFYFLCMPWWAPSTVSSEQYELYKYGTSGILDHSTKLQLKGLYCSWVVIGWNDWLTAAFTRGQSKDKTWNTSWMMSSITLKGTSGKWLLNSADSAFPSTCGIIN